MTDHDRRTNTMTTATTTIASSAMATTEIGVQGSATRIDKSNIIRGTILRMQSGIAGRSRKRTGTRHAG